MINLEFLIAHYTTLTMSIILEIISWCGYNLAQLKRTLYTNVLFLVSSTMSVFHVMLISYAVLQCTSSTYLDVMWIKSTCKLFWIIKLCNNIRTNIKYIISRISTNGWLGVHLLIRQAIRQLVLSVGHVFSTKSLNYSPFYFTKFSAFESCEYGKNFTFQ